LIKYGIFPASNTSRNSTKRDVELSEEKGVDLAAIRNSIAASCKTAPARVQVTKPDPNATVLNVTIGPANKKPTKRSVEQSSVSAMRQISASEVASKLNDPVAGSKNTTTLSQSLSSNGIETQKGGVQAQTLVAGQTGAVYSAPATAPTAVDAASPIAPSSFALALSAALCVALALWL